MATRILLAGGTGLVGGLLTARLLRRADVALDSVVRAARGPCQRAVDFEALVADPASIGPAETDVGVSCLGTTLRAAGSAAAFRRVDLNYVAAFARAARAAGATRFILVSSVGAGGRGLYLEVKGRAERAVASIGFERVDIVRPSLLLGPRTDRRPAEAAAQLAAPLLNPLMVGPLARYRAVGADVVAAAIDRLTGATAPGTHVHGVRELERLAA